MRVSQLLTSFNAGEWSPEMAARTDMQKYPSACHLMENFKSLVEGPARRRPGTRFVNTIKDQTNRVWIKKFEISSTQAYYLEFGNLYIRFFTNHGAVLETPVTITGATAASPVVITANAHGFSNGDVVFIKDVLGMRQINSRFFTVAGAAANTFQLSGVNGGAYTGYISGGTVARVYTIASPYSTADITNSEGVCTLRVFQAGSVMYIACKSPSGTGVIPQQLTRFTDTNWTLTQYLPTNGPFLELNTGTTALWATGQSGSVVVNSTAVAFFTTDVGRLIRLESQNSTVIPWETNKAVLANSLISFGNNVYKAMNAATTGTLPPTHISGNAYDGVVGVQWAYQHSGYGIVQITAFLSTTSVQCTVMPTQPGGIALLPSDVVGSAKAITGITQANPGVVTANAHGFSNQDVVYITSVVGMTQINNTFVTATGVAANTFNMQGVDTTGFTAYSSSGVATKNATTIWALGAWSATTEYPATVAFFRDRLWFGGRQRLWATVVNDFTNMAQDDFGIVTAANAISAVIQAEDVNNILWLVAAERLLLGTPGGEFAISEITSTEPLGPANVKIERQSRKRCRSVQPVSIGPAVVYVQKSGRKLMSMTYQFVIDKYQSLDITPFSRHITKPYIVDMAFQQEPDSILWLLRSDGALIGATVDFDQNVIAFNRHPIGGNGVVESIAIGQAPDGTREEIWLQVKRTLPGGATVRYVEFIEKDFDSVTDQIADAFYVDAGLTFDGTISTSTLTVGLLGNVVGSMGVPFDVQAGLFAFTAEDVGKQLVTFYNGVQALAVITSISSATRALATIVAAFQIGTIAAGSSFLASTIIRNLDHQEGQTVQVLRDGAESSDFVVSGGSVTLDKPARKAQLGLSCTCRLVPMRLEGGSQNGTSQGKIKRVHEIMLRFLDTVGGKCGPLNGKLDSIPFRTNSMPMDTAIPAFTGDKRLPFAGDYGRDDNQQTPNARPEYRNDKPFPATIVGMAPYFSNEDG